MSHRENQCRSRRGRGWHWFSRGDIFPCYPLMQPIIIIFYRLLIKYIVNITLVSKQSRSSEYLSLYFVLRKIKRSYDASQNLWWTIRAEIMHSTKFFFLEYHPSSSNITHCQVPSRVGAWFHDSLGDIEFNPLANQNQIFYMKV